MSVLSCQGPRHLFFLFDQAGGVREEKKLDLSRHARFAPVPQKRNTAAWKRKRQEAWPDMHFILIQSITLLFIQSHNQDQESEITNKVVYVNKKKNLVLVTLIMPDHEMNGEGILRTLGDGGRGGESLNSPFTFACICLAKMPACLVLIVTSTIAILHCHINPVKSNCVIY